MEGRRRKQRKQEKRGREWTKRKLNNRRGGRREGNREEGRRGKGGLCSECNVHSIKHLYTQVVEVDPEERVGVGDRVTWCGGSVVHI